MKVLTTLGEAQQHVVMPVKTGIQEGKDPFYLWILAFARMTRIRAAVKKSLT